MFFNAKTKLPLLVKTNDVWIHDEKDRLIDAGNQNKALDRTWSQSEGADVIEWDKHNGANQKFRIQWLNA